MGGFAAPRGGRGTKALTADPSPAHKAPMDEHWDAAQWAEFFGFDGAARRSWWRPDFLGLLLERWSVPAAAKILDLGAGTGLWGLGLFAHRPAGTLCLYERENFRDDAALLATLPGPVRARIERHTGDVHALPFPDASFDLVTGQTILLHVKDPDAALDEAYRVCRPGGVIAFAEPDNGANYLGHLARHRPPLSPDRIAACYNFYQTCAAGRIALGEGDFSIGARLPQRLAAAGCRDIDVAQNECVPFFVPPYDDPEQAANAAQAIANVDAGYWYFEDRAGAERRFLAGGGAPEAFAARWTEVWAVEESRAEAFRAGGVEGVEGQAFYIASGRKP